MRSLLIVTFAVAAGEQFVPRLFAELGVPILQIHVARPTLDDVFLALTGHGAEEDLEEPDLERAA